MTPPQLRRNKTKKWVEAKQSVGKRSRSQMFSAKRRGQKGETAAELPV